MLLKLPLHFAHGNGFPSESYQELFRHLHNKFEVHYIPIIGHGEYPITNNWDYLVQELIHNIQSQHTAPVIGLGHSMGGVLIYMAACVAPELFREIILLDAPIPGFWRSCLLKAIKRFKLSNYLMPIRRTRVRRTHFHSPEEAYEYFRTKSLFQHFTKESLEFYVRHGLEKTPQGYILRFQRDIETNLYLTMPDNLYRYRASDTLAASLIYNTNSVLMTPYELNAMKHYYGFRVYPFKEGSHLFPFEYPRETAKEIKKIVFNKD